MKYLILVVSLLIFIPLQPVHAAEFSVKTSKAKKTKRKPSNKAKKNSAKKSAKKPAKKKPKIVKKTPKRKPEPQEPFFHPPKKMLGLGLLGGTFESATLKFRSNSRNGFDIAGSFATGERDYFYFHAQFSRLYRESLSPLDWYWGVGLRFLNQQIPQTATVNQSALTELMIGPRLSLGVKYNLKFLLTELFLEVSATSNIVHQTDASDQFKADSAPIEGHAGFRFYL